MSKSFSNTFLYLLFFLLFILQACATHRPPVNQILDQKAEHLTEKARSVNQQIQSSKGTGWVRLNETNRVTTYKIAWAAVFPNKIRFTLLVSGLPVETVIADGKTISFTSHNNRHRPIQFKSKSPDLKKFIDLPVKVSELILVLLGRFPVSFYDDVYFSPDDPSSSTLILTQKWEDLRQVITLDKTEEIKEIRWEMSRKKLIFKLIPYQFQTMDGYRIASHLEFSDDHDRKVALEILSFQANPELKESVFRLTAQGS